MHNFQYRVHTDMYLGHSDLGAAARFYQLSHNYTLLSLCVIQLTMFRIMCLAMQWLGRENPVTNPLHMGH